MKMREGIPDASTFRLWQLVSPGFPVGAYSYSQGLETAIDRGWVADEPSTFDWIGGVASGVMPYVDLPVLYRFSNALRQLDVANASYWNAYLLSTRETAELRAEDETMGQALIRVLGKTEEGNPCPIESPISYTCAFAFAGHIWNIRTDDCAAGYLWSWAENQVLSALKLIPLGQTAGQRLLCSLSPVLSAAAERGANCLDEDIGMSAPGIAMASSWHENQYSRLFRS